jgi:hypothetical protein
MIEGICPQCQAHYHGQASSAQRNPLCIKCGSTLEIRENGFPVRTHFTPLVVQKYEARTDEKEWEDLCSKNLVFLVTLNLKNQTAT